MSIFKISHVQNIIQRISLHTGHCILSLLNKLTSVIMQPNSSAITSIESDRLLTPQSSHITNSKLPLEQPIRTYKSVAFVLGSRQRIVITVCSLASHLYPSHARASRLITYLASDPITTVSDERYCYGGREK